MQNGDIKGVVVEIVDCNDFFLVGVEVVGNSCCGWFIEQVQYVQVCQMCCVFGFLVLSVIEVSGNGNDYVVEFVGQCFGCLDGQCFEDIGGDVNWVQQVVGGLDYWQVVFIGLQLIWQMWVMVLNIGERVFYYLFYGVDGIGRILSGVKLGVIVDGQF